MNGMNIITRIITVFSVGMIFRLEAGTGVQRIYIKNSEPPLKGYNVQLVCDISQFGSTAVNIYKTDSALTDISGVVAITICLPSRCTKKSVGSYTFSTDSSHVYINITNLNRLEDEKWWTCAIEGQRKQLQLIIHTVPQTLDYDNPPSQDQNLAQNAVTLKCRTGCSYPQPSFTWFYNEPGESSIKWSSSEPVSENKDGCSDSEKKYISTLVLPKDASFPDRRDRTVKFVCSIVSFPGLAEPLNTSSSVNIQFAGSPNGPPTVLGFSDGDTLNVIESVQATLSCSISGGNPLATLTWSCYNSGSSPVTVYKTVTKSVTWTTLRNTDRTCSCQSDHPVAGKQAFSMKVKILYPPTKPSFGINSVTVSNTINIIRNNPLIVSCISSGHPVPSYKWTLPSTATRDGSTLSVSSVQREGRYICKVENSMHLTNGSVIPGSDSSSVDVHLLYPPSKPIFTYGSMTGPSISSRSIDVIKDDTFSVVCTSDGEPAPTYKWNNLPNSRILTVNRIAADQTYKCTASNRMNETVGESRIGSASAILSVNVLYPPRNVDIKYHYGKSSQIKITSLSIIEGKPFTVKCSSNSIPPPSYSWIGKVTSNSETLTVESTQKTHIGTYTCNVENTMIRSFPNPQTEVKGTNNKSINLQVLYPPRIEDLRNQSAVDGEPFTISCPVAVGNPSETTYQWTRATDDQTWHSQTFTINAVSRNDAMIYTCTVYNTMKQTAEQAITLPDARTFYLDVRYSASVKEFFITGHKGETTITMNETEKVTFECLVDSNPGSTILVMYQKNTKLSMADTKTLKYEIKSAMCIDRGAYSCVGFNQYNKDNSSKILNLLVNCSPRPSPFITIKENVTSALHAPATLALTTLAYPEPKEDDFTWYRWSTNAWLELSNSDKFRIETDASQSNLTIMSVNRTLFGAYKMDVKNIIGSYEQIFNLIPEDKPDPPTGFQLLENTITQTSFTVQWSPSLDNGPEQTFVIRYRKVTENNWKSIKIADTGISKMNYKFSSLSSGTEYDVVLFASNRLGNSSETDTLRIKTKDATATTKSASVTGGAIGGSVGFVIGISAFAVGYIIIRRIRTIKRQEVEETRSGILSSNYMDLQPVRGYTNSSQEYTELPLNKSADSNLKSDECKNILIKTRDKSQTEHIYKNTDQSLCQEEQFKVYENLKIGDCISSTSKQIGFN